MESKENITPNPSEKKEKKKFHLSNAAKTYLISMGIIFLLMLAAFIVTKTLPAGKFRTDETGKIIPGSYYEKTNNFPVWKFLLSPFLMFGGNGGTTAALIIVFLFIISGVMYMMERGKVLNYVLDRIVGKFGKRRYLLLCIVTFFFMALGSLVGSFEEVVPFVPLLIILVAKLGFDKYVGIQISILAVACGFGCGVLNPFTVGTAQKLAGLKMFSGASMRILSFFLVYILLTTFILLRARKNAKENPNALEEIKMIEKNDDLSKAGIAFGVSLLVGFIMVIVSIFVEPLQSYSLVFLAVAFVIGGFLSSYFAKIKIKDSLLDFLKGMKSMIPAAFMLMFASSIRYILEESERLDTILNFLINSTTNVPKVAMVLIIYGIVLFFNIFIPSGSAKAFLLIPLLAPMASAVGISLQLVILAFAFGDGFSNLAYPTNPVLLISLNLSDTSYGKYIKVMWPFFLALLILSSCILLLGFGIGY